MKDYHILFLLERSAETEFPWLHEAPSSEDPNSSVIKKPIAMSVQLYWKRAIFSDETQVHK